MKTQAAPNPSPMSPTEAYSTNDKLQWEVRKLQVEIANLSKPFLKQPASWFGLAALALSLSGNVIQFSSAERLRQLAEIRKERLELDALTLERKSQQLETEIAARKSALEVMKIDLQKHGEQLAALKADIKSTKVSREALVQRVEEAQQSSSGIIAGILAAVVMGMTPDGNTIRPKQGTHASAGSPKAPPAEPSDPAQ